MTREEAILRIEDHIEVHKYREVAHMIKILEAFDFAIKALKQPEIIHCKDCKHRTFHDNRISSEQCYVCDYWDFDDPQPNGFCNFAERREG